MDALKPNYHARPKMWPAFRSSLHPMQPTPHAPPAQATPFLPSQAQLMKGVQSVIGLGGTHKGPRGEGFAVIEFDGTTGPGGILVAVPISFHFERADAERCCKSKTPEGGCGNA